MSEHADNDGEHREKTPRDSRGSDGEISDREAVSFSSAALILAL